MIQAYRMGPDEVSHSGRIVRVEQVVNARRDLRGRYTLQLKDRPESLRSSQSYGHLFKQMWWLR